MPSGYHPFDEEMILYKNKNSSASSLSWRYVDESNLGISYFAMRDRLHNYALKLHQHSRLQALRLLLGGVRIEGPLENYFLNFSSSWCTLAFVWRYVTTLVSFRLHYGVQALGSPHPKLLCAPKVPSVGILPSSCCSREITLNCVLPEVRPSPFYERLRLCHLCSSVVYLSTTFEDHRYRVPRPFGSRNIFMVSFEASVSIEKLALLSHCLVRGRSNRGGRGRREPSRPQSLMTRSRSVAPSPTHASTEDAVSSRASAQSDAVTNVAEQVIPSEPPPQDHPGDVTVTTGSQLEAISIERTSFDGGTDVARFILFHFIF